MTKTVLVIGGPDLRRLVHQTLKCPSCQVVEAVVGLAAWELIREAPPDLLIVDELLPGRGGLEVQATLEGDPRISETPAIILTDPCQPRKSELGMAASPAACLQKPFSPLELVRQVELAIGELTWQCCGGDS